MSRIKHDAKLGPFQLGSRDQIFPGKFLYYGPSFEECQKWKKGIENTKIAKSEAPRIKEWVYTTV